MYQLFCLLSGIVLAFVITFNGSLSEYYGPYVGAVIVHIVGTVVAYIVMKAMKQTWRPKEKLPLWMYTGGIIGIGTTVFQSIAFAKIGVVAVMALSLFGQTLTSLVVDGFGVGGMEKRKIGKSTIMGVLVSFCGMAVMLMGESNMRGMPLVMGIAAGVTAVISRLANAQLSERTSAIGSSFTNHWVGLVGCIVLTLVAEPDIMGCLQVTGVPAWMYIGGACGVLMIMLWNIAGPRVSAFRLTLLSFIGQVFMGVVLDLLLGNGFSMQIFMGGMCVMAGAVLNMLTDKKD